MEGAFRDPGLKLIETELWDGLFEVAGELTVLAISHRPMVLERADEVVELRAGRRVSSP